MDWKVFAWGRSWTWLPYIVFSGLCAAQFYFGVIGTQQSFSIAQVLVLLAGGAFFWTLVEYALHRFIFHLPAKEGEFSVPANHWAHHKTPQDLGFIVAPLFFSLPLYGLFYLGFYSVFGSGGAAIFGVGFIAGYMFYEWVHTFSHVGSPKNRLTKFLKRMHMLHHFKDDKKGFGVSSPFWDNVFGTRISEN